ncbi:transglycosylase domain-containing protein [Amycolatopsis taiwanensis]|uniref:Penicillin-binding protein n=1 Tax=Amycolatopsis taiwanensis TaxID=342230 RepID=A0A9W6R573_9PSEU|nr:transglycosylase domain-containing protein [Amycolatopsis taiwanensis]GLY68863.1 penicillin-binding protein [Amycolatopsis taiwanensis]
MRRKVFWRRTRRTLYVLMGMGLLVPVAAFVITYMSVSVPDPSALAASHDQKVTLYYADGSVMYEKSPSGSHAMVSWEQIPDVMKDAQMAAEDATFMTNNGFDVAAILRTVWNRLSGGTGGGSTIGQEYIKNATGNDQNTLQRKFVEMVQSFKMTRTYSKQDILTAYLNTVYFGRGAYGIQAAAHAFFNEDVSKLTAEQSALLAGLVQAPGAANNEAYQHRRYNYVMGRMLANHWITQEEYDTAQFPTPVPNSDSGSSSLSPVRQYIVAAVFDELARQGHAEQDLFSSGAKIYTTIDPKSQGDAEAAVTKIMAADAEYPDEAAALVSADPTTGGIMAYYGGDGSTSYDLAMTPQQPGSSFKPYVLTAALQNSPDTIGLDTMYDGSDNQTIAGHTVHNSDGESAAQISVKDAMTESINTVFYQMGYQVGVNNVRQAAWDAGIPKQITPALGDTFDTLQNVDNGKGTGVTELGISIGQYPVRPIDQAQGYATFANDGMYIPVHFVSRVTDSGGGQIYQFATEPKPAFSSDATTNAAIARTVTESMTDVAAHSGDPLAGNRPTASKTGTAQYLDTGHNAQAWMVGYTPQNVTAVWFGNKTKPGPIYGNYHNGKGKEHGYDVYGREEPAYIWKEYMDAHLSGKPVKQFSQGQLITGSAPTSSVEPTSTQETTPPETPTDTSKPSKTKGHGGPSTFPSCIYTGTCDFPLPTSTGRRHSGGGGGG